SLCRFVVAYYVYSLGAFFFFSSRRRHTRSKRDWSSDVCSSDLPTPRSYSYKLPRKVRRLAIKSVLSQKVADESLVVVDALNFDAPKTKAFAEVLSNLNVNSKVLVVLEDDNTTAALAARNLKNVTVIPAKGLNVLDVINNDKLVITQGALSQVEEVLA